MMSLAILIDGFWSFRLQKCQAIPMTRSFMHGHQNDVVHRFPHQEVWIVDTVYDYLVLQSVCNGVHQREVYRKIMLKHWQHVVRIAAVQNIKVLIHRRQVSFSINFANFVLYKLT